MKKYLVTRIKHTLRAACLVNQQSRSHNFDYKAEFVKIGWNLTAREDNQISTAEKVMGRSTSLAGGTGWFGNR